MGDRGGSRAVPRWAVTVYWGVVGALVAFGVAGLATIGPFLLALASVFVVGGLAAAGLRPPSVPGALLGLSTAPFYIAWLNRGGPGTVCTSTADVMACTDQWSPWPFVAVGVLVAGAAVALLVTARRRGGAPPSTESAADGGTALRT